ncbi:hypothetical protein EI77_00215 [Prosthecobacter fusiformis]|uniref:Uncharacterized protein n=1 Tax=Prosthecobacter fusiformis TaxID=48464 RepID=A0A4R7SPS4_9BACT|nr:hypothetical protein [Prosthecobacter fusiformis]TDU80914.1 hypothetical protein EI77_00215 [Prosthecobacter fusiformis]
MHQGARYNPGNFRAAKNTTAMTSIKFMFQAACEAFELLADGGRQIFHSYPPIRKTGINAVLQQPVITLCTPALPNGGGYGISHSPSDKIRGPFLVPVWQITLRNGHLGERAEELKTHATAPTYPNSMRGQVLICPQKVACTVPCADSTAKPPSSSNPT